MPSDFRELVRRGVRIAGSQRALGKAIGVSEEIVSRVMNGRGYPFNDVNCVRLARLIGERDWVVLRAGNKGDLADLLEQAYGDKPMRAVHDPFEGLTTMQRRRLAALARDMARGNAK